jgi:hypothetical protein
MVSGELLEIRIDPEQPSGSGDDDARFFLQFAAKRGVDFLASFDAATREMPAGTIAVTDEQDALFGVNNKPLNAERRQSGAVR